MRYKFKHIQNDHKGFIGCDMLFVTNGDVLHIYIHVSIKKHASYNAPANKSIHTYSDTRSYVRIYVVCVHIFLVFLLMGARNICY